MLIKFRDFIEEHGGLNIEKEKFDSLRISIHTRATRNGLSSYEEYYNKLIKSEDEFRNLISLLAVNETYFFRYPEQFKILKEYVIPKIVEENKLKPVRSIRIWSAGCSTGEEAYSIAITILESNLDLSNWEVHILGTDVSNQALKKAVEGKYYKNSFRITDEEFKKKYFRKISEDSWEVVSAVKNLVTFTYHNLIKEPYPLAFMELWDVIFCRNVTIYFKPESTKRVIHNLFNSLKPGGFLFTGHTETLYHINPGFEVIKFGDAFIFRKPTQKENRIFSLKTELPKNVQKEVGTQSSTYVWPLDSEDLVQKISEIQHKDKDLDSSQKLDFYKKLIYSLLDENKTESALEQIDKAMRLSSNDPEIYYLRGLSLKRMENFSEAESDFRKAIYLDKNHYLSQIELANLLALNGDIKQALRYYKSAINSLNHLRKIDDSNNEEMEMLVKICEMMIEDLKSRED
ncbi:MAG: tetratricopeptide repeat protein [Actinobacteria bacterium]|nr:tetratricopeptide repeat protein [Actinomycetota bacterium]